MLRHELDEDFHFVIENLTKQSNQLIKRLYKEKYPHKGTDFLYPLQESILADKVQIDYNIWTKALGQMYESTDAMIIEDRIKSLKTANQIDK